MALVKIKEELNSQIINYHPTLISPNIPLLEIINKLATSNNYLIVAEHLTPLGVITWQNIIKIVVSGINIYSLRAENVCQSFPCDLEEKIIDIYTIAQQIYQRKYTVYGCLNSNGELTGIISPRSLTDYLANDYFYQQIKIRDLLNDNLLIAKGDDYLITLIEKLNEQPDKLGFILVDKSPIKVITYQHLISSLTDPNWKNKTIGELEFIDDIPELLATEQISAISKILDKNSAILIHNYPTNSSCLSSAKEHNLNGNQYNKTGTNKLGLVTCEQLIRIFTPQWQHYYLNKQQRELTQLKTAVKLEKKQVEQEKLLSQLSYRIRQSLNLEKILNSTVNEVRQFLECDRVIIYQLYPDGDGVVIAESVQKGILSILGRVIRDHCFAQDFVKPYLNGRIQATDNVLTANLSPCHLDLLLAIQVQANLVVPIVFHDQLWGLLAAQNSHNPRSWQEEELELLKKLGSQVAIAIQQSQSAEKALQIAKHQTAIASLGKTALVTNDVETFIQSTVEIVAETLKIEYCSFLELQPNHAAFVVKAGVGWGNKWLGIAKMSSSPRWMPGYTLKTFQPVVTEDLLIETRFSPPPFLHNTGIVSGATVNVGDKNKCSGVIGIYSKISRKFNPEEINFLQTVANVLATAIERTKSQRQLDYFFHLSLDMFCIANVDGTLQRINSSFLTTLGYGEKEMIGQNMLAFVHPEDKAITLQELKKLSRGFPSVNFENRWQTADGQYRWLAWKSLPYEEDIIYAVARDITLAKQAELQLRSLNEELETRVKNRTEELQRTSTQLKTFVQTAGTILVVLNQEYRILEWNEEATEIFGWARDDVLGEDYFLLFVAPSERDNLQSQLNTTLKEGKVQRNLESKVMIADGSERTLLWNINRFTDNHGKGIGVVACGQDIEEVRLAQLRLKLSEEKFRSIFNQAAVGILQVSLPGKLVLVNDKFTQLIGFTRQQLADLDFPCLIHPDDVSDTLTDLSELLDSQKPTFEREIRMSRPNGEFLWVNLTMSVVWVSVEPSYFIAVINDISDRKQAEESLQESEARLNSVLSSLQDVVWSISLPDLQPRYINPACQELFGYSPQEVLANSHLLIEVAVAEYRQQLQQDWDDIVESYHLGELQSSSKNKTWESEYQIQLPSGEYKWIRDRSHIVYDRYGRAVSIDGISTDVTQRHEAEEKLYKSLQEKEVLLKEIHHRVKNNLYVISGLLNLQSSYVEDETVKNLFYDSQNRIQTMAVIHEQLYQSEDLSEINFADYIKRLVDNLFISYNQHQQGIKSITNLEDCYLNIETAIPAGLLINELITNAFKHAFPDNKGEITIELKRIEPDLINLKVQDNGQGFPPDLNWKQSPSLGLRLVRLLSRQLDAEITVNSSGKGTNFCLEFMPLAI